MTGWLVLLLAAAVAFLTAYLPLLLILSPALWAYAGARTKPYLLLLPAAVFAAGSFVLNPPVVAAGLTGASGAGKETVARLRADTKTAAGHVSRLAFNLDRAVFFDPQTEQRIV